MLTKKSETIRNNKSRKANAPKKILNTSSSEAAKLG
jgi:hypothetical protein